LAINLRISEKKMIQTTLEAVERYRDRLFPEEASMADNSSKKKKNK
jgi:hypothetical protein